MVGIGFFIYWVVLGILLIFVFVLVVVFFLIDVVVFFGIVGEGCILKKIMGIL